MRNRPTTPFIAINILPPSEKLSAKEADAVFAKVKEQLDEAIKLGFKQAWFNPITEGVPGRICSRYSLDTGVNTDLFNSLYAPNDPSEPSNIMNALKERLSDLFKQYQRDHQFTVLVDFVWKHVGVGSKLVTNASTKKWFGKKIVKDVIEYDFDSSESANIIEHLKRTIDVYLDPEEFGFGGLRVDAASHLNPKARRAFYEYVEAKYPNAIILEEVLFDQKQEATIRKLIEDAAQEPNVYSSFVTSNTYYQKIDAFGAMPSPSKMGDAEKLKLAQNRGISFTSNHDHYSLGWGVVLSMAAKRAAADSQFMKSLRDSNISVTPIDNDKFNDNVSFSLKQAEQNILNIANGSQTIEAISGEIGASTTIKFLLSYANEIALELIGIKQSDEKIFAQFRKELLEKMVDRTVSSPAGYFMLFADIDNLLENHRIFSNKSGEKLTIPFITAEDVKNTKVTDNMMDEMKEETKSGKNKKYKNITNFGKQASLVQKGKADNSANITFAARLWVPFIIDYLMDNPAKNAYQNQETLRKIEDAKKALASRIGVPAFVKKLNEIYLALKTKDTLSYETFTSLDDIKIIIRTTKENTDIIILNLNPDKKHLIEDMDLEKIALFYQARKFSIDEAYKGREVVKAVSLSSPGDKAAVKYADAEYAEYWRGKDAAAFDFSYTRITGQAANHQTNLYVGANVDLYLNKYNNIAVVVGPELSQAEKDRKAFHDVNAKPTSAPSLHGHSLFAEKGKSTSPASSPPRSPTKTKMKRREENDEQKPSSSSRKKLDLGQ